MENARCFACVILEPMSPSPPGTSHLKQDRSTGGLLVIQQGPSRATTVGVGGTSPSSPEHTRPRCGASPSPRARRSEDDDDADIARDFCSLWAAKRGETRRARSAC